MPILESRAPEAGHHVVQFYDSDADLVSRAGGYLSEAAKDGAVGIVIATEAHRAAFEAHLRADGVDVGAARDEGTLVVLDAAATLARFMRDGSVDRDAFLDVVGAVVHAAAATGRPVRAYGEMVALLWDAGNVLAAIDLETLWNELSTEVGFALYCAYRSDSVAGHEHAAALQRVCHLHSSVEETWHFAPEDTAPGEARRLLAGALRRMVHDRARLEDAQIVITELAANAVLHARSPFSVSLRSDGSAIRILVRDRSHVTPVMRERGLTTPSGRGMHLIAAIAGAWGVELAADGKVVWAELRPGPAP